MVDVLEYHRIMSSDELFRGLEREGFQTLLAEILLRFSDGCWHWHYEYIIESTKDVREDFYSQPFNGKAHIIMKIFMDIRFIKLEERKYQLTYKGWQYLDKVTKS